MTTDSADLLRSMVREVLRDVLPGLVEEAAVARLAGAPAAATPSGSSLTARPTAAADHGGRETVMLRTDAELDAFVQRVVALAQNPVTRQQLTTGRLRFGLGHGGGAAAEPTAAVRRVERGAVTERAVRDAAAAGQSLLLARGVVLTPLARDRARALGVTIEKER